MANIKNLIKLYLPMSEASFLVLSSLREPMHGYGIMQNILELTKGRVNLGAGTVYTILYKMEGDGLIKVLMEEDRRKIYQITDLGREILESEAKRITELSNIAQPILSESVALYSVN